MAKKARQVKEDHRNYNCRQYWKVLLLPDNETDVQLITNWKQFLLEEGIIIHTFFETVDPFLSNAMDGNRGELWEYLPLNEENVDWPNEFIIYQI